MKIPLAQPDLTALERQAVLDVLDSTFLSLGPKLPEFERAMAAYAGVKHAVAVNSGTSALHLIVRALGLGSGDEVITTPFSFVSSANCILMEGAAPVFVDVDSDTYNLDPARIEPAITPRTKAILGVDVFGRCAPWDQIESVARKHRLMVIEDSCEAIGAELRERKAGSFGEAGCYAFYPNKQMTTGEGGMIVTNREDLAALCRSMRNQGRDEGQGWLVHSRLGYNYRLTELQCALGLVQLARLDDMLARRAEVAALYQDRLSCLNGLVLPAPVSTGRLSWFVYVVRLDERFTREDRDRILHGMRAAGIGCAPYFPVIHLQEYYTRTFGYRQGDYPIAEGIADRTLALPFFNALTTSQVDEVADCLEYQIRMVGR